MILGSGQEGVVMREGGAVHKRFHPGWPGGQHVPWLQAALRDTMPHIPEPAWTKENGSWLATYPWFETEPVARPTLDELERFFSFCLERSIVALNIKCSNFRRHERGLAFIDIGRDIRPMNVDFFRDACARGFALAELGWTDAELQKRSHELRSEAGLRSLPRFGNFYGDLLLRHAQRQWESGTLPAWPAPSFLTEPTVTLLIKACAMDASALDVQVRHIVRQLEAPRRFAERLLLLDPHPGPFVRAHCAGDWGELQKAAQKLLGNGWVERVLIAPGDKASVAEINRRWFNFASPHSHSASGIPVAPHLWGFEAVRTRHVLQCDADVLIGRRDRKHDYLAEVLSAVSQDNALGAAFNISHAPDSPFRDYGAPPGEFVPEVRCGLLDLQRIFACRPLPNSLQDGRLALTWYRSLQMHQQQQGLRTLRGGDSRTFYVHPPNAWKCEIETLDRVRDLVSQGRIPPPQFEKWDLCAPSEHWRYEKRPEPIVFVVRGRNTAPEKAVRCLRSLAMQECQNFGIILIDDASDGSLPVDLPQLLQSFAGRYTLVQRNRRHGYMPNTLLAVSEIIACPDALAVILDFDDALFHRVAVTRLAAAVGKGADVVLAAMFRPDKPAKLYHPDFHSARAKWGGEVWIHLRSFKKRLFDALPRDTLMLDGQWISNCEDYAVMIPIVELASRPLYLPEYLYFHERSTATTPELRALKDEIIRRILSKPALRDPDSKPSSEL